MSMGSSAAGEWASCWEPAWKPSSVSGDLERHAHGSGSEVCGVHSGGVSGEKLANAKAPAERRMDGFNAQKSTKGDFNVSGGIGASQGLGEPAGVATSPAICLAQNVGVSNTIVGEAEPGNGLGSEPAHSITGGTGTCSERVHGDGDGRFCRSLVVQFNEQELTKGSSNGDMCASNLHGDLYKKQFRAQQGSDCTMPTSRKLNDDRLNLEPSHHGGARGMRYANRFTARRMCGDKSPTDLVHSRGDSCPGRGRGGNGDFDTLYGDTANDGVSVSGAMGGDSVQGVGVHSEGMSAETLANAEAATERRVDDFNAQKLTKGDLNVSGGIGTSHGLGEPAGVGEHARLHMEVGGDAEHAPSMSQHKLVRHCALGLGSHCGGASLASEEERRCGVLLANADAAAERQVDGLNAQKLTNGDLSVSDGQSGSVGERDLTNKKLSERDAFKQDCKRWLEETFNAQNMNKPGQRSGMCDSDMRSVLATARLLGYQYARSLRLEEKEKFNTLSLHKNDSCSGESGVVRMARLIAARALSKSGNAKGGAAPECRMHGADGKILTNLINQMHVSASHHDQLGDVAENLDT